MALLVGGDEMAKQEYKVNVTVNHEHGEEYVQYLAHGRKDVAEYVRDIMVEFQFQATSFVFTIARVGETATPNAGGDVE